MNPGPGDFTSCRLKRKVDRDIMQTGKSKRDDLEIDYFECLFRGRNDMKISFDEVILRDYQLSDVEDEVRWTNTDTTWFYSDTPWMTLEPADPDELRADMLDVMSGLSENAIRWRFEIEVAGQHIGTVSSYYLDEHYESTPWESIDQCKNAEENRSIRGLGIEICEMSFWGRGIGGKALTAFMEYYRSLGEHRFFLETWSGNARMLGCAGKLGFSEVKRQKGTYVVDGKAYDGLVLEKRF